MDKLHFHDFFPDLLTEGHCVMVDLPQHEGIMEYISRIPNECIYEEEGKHYGKEKKPHITVMYGLEPIAEEKAKMMLSKIPKRISATLGKISKFENADTPYDVLKIEVHSPHLTKIHETLKRTCENNYQWPNYNPHVTLAYVKKGSCNEMVGDKTFEGQKFTFEAFTYSNGVRQENHPVVMSEAAGSSVKAELNALSEKYKEHLESWLSVGKHGISLDQLRAVKTAPKGTGTAFMNELIGIADKHGLMITLQTAVKDRTVPEPFKKTSSANRLKDFYSRFGFKSNYGARSYRADLPGNMHREPKGKMQEYFVGQSAGYGGGAMAGGAVAPMNWAGTQSSPQTSRRLKDYPASRRYTYMQGNTVIGNSLYDTITADDLKDPRFSADEIFAGLRSEMRKMEYPDKDVARPIVIKNLEKNPKFYSDLDQYFKSDQL